MLERHVCPKCGHHQILLVREVADRDDGSFPRVAHVAIVRPTHGSEGFAGRLSAAVCRGCGYTELYTRDPESIPIDGTYVSLLEGPPSSGPFR